MSGNKAILNLKIDDVEISSLSPLHTTRNHLNGFNTVAIQGIVDEENLVHGLNSSRVPINKD